MGRIQVTKEMSAMITEMLDERIYADLTPEDGADPQTMRTRTRNELQTRKLLNDICYRFVMGQRHLGFNQARMILDFIYVKDRPDQRDALIRAAIEEGLEREYS